MIPLKQKRMNDEICLRGIFVTDYSLEELEGVKQAVTEQGYEVVEIQ